MGVLPWSWSSKDEYDREGLEKTDIPLLTAPYTKVFTPGIWVRI